MLRERQYILRVASIALDLALAAAAVLVAHGARQTLAMYVAPGLLRPARLEHYAWLLVATPLLTTAALAYYGLYASIGVRTRTRAVVGRIALACLVTAVLLVTIEFFIGDVLRPSGTVRTSWSMLVLLPAVTFALLTAKTWLLRRWLMRRRLRGRDDRRVVLVGSGKPLEEFVAAVRVNPLWGMDIVGLVTDRPEAQGEAFAPETVPEGSALGLAVLSDLEQAPAMLWATPVDEVVFLPDATALSRMRPLLEICEEMGVRTHVPLNFFRGAIARPVVDHFEEIPVLSYWPTHPIGPALVFKYAFDRVAAVLALIVLAIPMALVALGIRLTGKAGEPVLFGQTRCGLNGRLFTMWKFRTMHGGAEAQRAELEARNEQSGPVFKMADDPRITTPGRWLRKFSMDELPQLWNVARGEMSLVGPRPPLPGEVEQYDRWQRRRLSMKPGITCLWQVSGRNKIGFDAWMRLDLEYIDNWSLLLDFKILCRTVYVVVTGYGAM
jgi:exopolysaccharide biosynthesis polyprenyl glycosylphosphotransferase